jgi:hypothetical protein
MKNLEKDWLTSGLIDFEYKKYILLSYLQGVRSSFDDRKLYPHLSDLVFHYQNLQSLKQNKELLFENFPGKIERADFEKLKIHYKKMVEDDSLMRELELILSFALPALKSTLNEGKSLYEYIEEQLEVEPIGVCPLYANDGYLLVNERLKKTTQVYQYQITVFESVEEKYRGIHTKYLETVEKTLSRTFESLKIELIRKYPDLPNPATYLIDIKEDIPFHETAMPMAKRLLVKYISAAA